MASLILYRDAGWLDPVDRPASLCRNARAGTDSSDFPWEDTNANGRPRRRLSDRAGDLLPTPAGKARICVATNYDIFKHNCNHLQIMPNTWRHSGSALSPASRFQPRPAIQGVRLEFASTTLPSTSTRTNLKATLEGGRRPPAEGQSLIRRMALAAPAATGTARLQTPN